MIYEIEVVANDKLSKLIYTFTLIDLTVRLNTYSMLERQTKAHGWKRKRRYDRLNKRDSDMTFEQVPLTQSITDEALAKVRESITFKMTSQ